MKKKVDLYKKISLDIVEAFENEDFDEIDILLNERQEIIDEEYEKEKLKILLVQSGVLNIDKEISRLFDISIMNVKNEIRKCKKTKLANNSYVDSNRNNLQIFLKKV